MHGQGTDKYDNVRIGLTCRLDTIQAAVLIEKLKIFPDEIEARNRVAAPLRRRPRAMSPSCRACRTASTSVWAQYTIRLKPGARDGLAAALQGAGHSDRDLLSDAAAPAAGLQGISRSPTAACRSASSSADEVISLPMHAYLDEPTQDRIIAAVRNELGRN